MLAILKSHKSIIAWFLVVSVLTARLIYVFFYAEDRSAILPGETTNGHHQIEQQCEVCHTDEEKENVFTTTGVPNSACNSCHADDLEEFSDSHPVRKFKNPENAIFLEHIDALNCVECHSEHNQKITQPMGVTIPADYCAHCHEVTLENLDSHKELAFNTCDGAGCHNYHDNTALAPSFLLKQFGIPDHLEKKQVPAPNVLARMEDEGYEKGPALPREAAAAPSDKLQDTTAVEDWSHSAHAEAGVNCMDCHQDQRVAPGVAWIEHPTHQTCANCHDTETTDFLKGKHGMRLAHEGLSPMTPAMARLPMKAEAAHHSLDCSSCHSSHRYDREFASHQACISCHDDSHTRNYERSKHFKSWKSELAGTGPAHSGVSCATCHMPSITREGHQVINHNQNANLTPNEKMLYNTCMHCHGAEFAMSALADRDLIEKNFVGEPETRHPGVTWSAQSAIRRGDEAAIKMKEYLDKLQKKTQ